MTYEERLEIIFNCIQMLKDLKKYENKVHSSIVAVSECSPYESRARVTTLNARMYQNTKVRDNILETIKKELKKL